jgi:hypothetical protein
VLEILATAAVSAVVSHYLTPHLPQFGQNAAADKKLVKEVVRQAVGAPTLLADYRFVTATVLIVRLNPKAQSPEVARFKFGTVVKVLAKGKDFSLVQWTDPDGKSSIQGWVFSGYLKKFN